MGSGSDCKETDSVSELTSMEFASLGVLNLDSKDLRQMESETVQITSHGGGNLYLA